LTAGVLRVAAARYAIGAPADFAAFAVRQASLLQAAADAGTQLAVLPEYLSLELGATLPVRERADLHGSLAALQPLHGDWLALYARLARQLRMHIVAGSFLLAVAPERYRNRSYWFAPDGRHGWQDKLQLTGFEKQAGVIEPGDALKVFECDGVRVGVSVCYDIEFPLPVRAQCEAGARVIAVPSCTDTKAGATRVRVGGLARALENRCFVVQAVTAGDAPWSPALDTNTGDAAIYAPMDVGLPADGVLARAGEGQDWAIATLDLAALDASRSVAQVANDRDWTGQLAPAVQRARLDTLEPSSSIDS